MFQRDVKGGLITYAADVLGRVNIATANFAANSTDPKAVIVTGYAYTFGQVRPSNLSLELQHIHSYTSVRRDPGPFLRCTNTTFWNL